MVRNFIMHVSGPGVAPFPAQPAGKLWASWGAEVEYGTWLTGVDLLRILGDDLRNEVVVATDEHRSEARSLLQCSAPYVARVRGTGEFVALIDRSAYLNDVAARLLVRLDSSTSNIKS